MVTKNYWLAPLLAAVLVACIGWWGEGKISDALTGELSNDLRSTLNADVTALEIWLKNQQKIAAMLTDEPRLKVLASDLLASSPAMESNRVAQITTTRQLLFGDKLQQRLVNLDYVAAQLVNTNFEVVLDTSPMRQRRGVRISEELRPKYAELFASNETIVITPFKLQAATSISGRTNRLGRAFSNRQPNIFPGMITRDMMVMQVAAPLRTTNGITCGALVLTLNPDAEFTRILSVAHSGESGETFAFDPEGVMISKSRFDDRLKEFGLIAKDTNATSALTLRLADPGGDLYQGFKMDTKLSRPLMTLVDRAINLGGSGVEITPFRDYRGVPVIGAWSWLPKYGFGVATKIDAAEAYETLRIVRGVFLILFLLLIFAALTLLIFSYRQFVWRTKFTEAELKARQLGQYKLVSKISEGGMGVLYKAHHALLRRETAIKLLLPDKADQLAIQRFEREVRLTCLLTHPNTIQVYDYGHTPEGLFYYAMEYLDGLDLAELISSYGLLTEGRAIHLLMQICDSLNEAHPLGLVHRDIKPANIVVCDRGGVADMVKVLDFGLVKTFDQTHGMQQDETEAEMIVGTPSYMSPEAYEDSAQVDYRSDLYSIGAVGYYLLTGQAVFAGDNWKEICERRRNEIPEPPSRRIGRTICPHLEAVIMQLLDRNPENRPKAAWEVRQLLAASPLAGTWTREDQTAWWESHRASVAQVRQDAAPATTSATVVNIAVSKRT
jgi:tRNA A-37 threonylcarbamoyl transferase component Bud32